MAEFRMLVRPADPMTSRLARDVAYIKRALNAKRFDASDRDIEWAWDQFSRRVDAGWSDPREIPRRDIPALLMDVLVEHGR